ncbi:MAG TPA: hypothetical protein VHV83_13690, partial [Armatimonadota bacterium]|nr:hypothetical protein [Armatimonadota bacterium]
MKFISIRKKFISFATQILLGTLAVSQFTASTLVILRTHRTFKEVENKIEKSLIDKGKLLVLNNGIALRAMVEDYAFTSIRELVSSTIQKDRDVV